MTEDKCTCENPHDFTPDGECYSCWSNSVDREFPDSNAPTIIGIFFLVALITAFVIMAVGAGRP